MHALGHVLVGVVKCRRFNDSSVREVIGDGPDGRCWVRLPSLDLFGVAGSYEESLWE
jgi:hypothetical protein